MDSIEKEVRNTLCAALGENPDEWLFAPLQLARLAAERIRELEQSIVSNGTEVDI